MKTCATFILLFVLAIPLPAQSQGHESIDSWLNGCQANAVDLMQEEMCYNMAFSKWIDYQTQLLQQLETVAPESRMSILTQSQEAWEAFLDGEQQRLWTLYPGPEDQIMTAAILMAYSRVRALFLESHLAEY